MRSLTAIALGFFVAHGSAFAQSPTMSCGVYGSSAGRTADAPVVVTNLEPPRIVVDVYGDPDAIEGPRLMSSADLPPTVSVRVLLLAAGTPITIEHVAVAHGAHQDGASKGIDVTLQLAQDPTQRRLDIEAFLEYAIRVSPEDPRSIQLLLSQKEGAIKAFERFYYQSQPGLYAVECQFTSRAEGKWNGVVTAPRLYLRLRDDGKFFDQPQFRQK